MYIYRHSRRLSHPPKRVGRADSLTVPGSYIILLYSERTAAAPCLVTGTVPELSHRGLYTTRNRAARTLRYCRYAPPPRVQTRDDGTIAYHSTAVDFDALRWINNTHMAAQTIYLSVRTQAMRKPRLSALLFTSYLCRKNTTKQ